jgi:catechol 2,3-dioxygenase-like lactoylglutathione lyase family enzyme
VTYRRPSCVTLRVRDLDRAVAFYREALRLPIKLAADGMVELQTETFVLALVADPSATPASGTGPAIGWEVGDLDAAARDLSAHGVTCEAVAPPRGVAAEAFGRRVRFLDPDGHALELITYA